jgi:hypothetical protein
MTKRRAKQTDDPQDFLDQLEAKRKPRRRWLRWGCGGLLAVLVACGALSFLILSDPDVRARVALTQTAIALLPTATRTPTPSATHTPSATFTPSPTPRPSSTPLPSRTPTIDGMATTYAQASALAATQFTALTPSFEVQEISEYRVYVQGDTRARACPFTDCEIVGTYQYGDQVDVDAIAIGTTVSGTPEWFRVRWRDGRIVYIHQSLTMVSLPLPTSPPIQAFSGSGNSSSGGSNNATCPRNCDEARAMGVSASFAASCGLDRDRDGVACYGD